MRRYVRCSTKFLFWLRSGSKGKVFLFAVSQLAEWCLTILGLLSSATFLPNCQVVTQDRVQAFVLFIFPENFIVSRFGVFVCSFFKFLHDGPAVNYKTNTRYGVPYFFQNGR